MREQAFRAPQAAIEETSFAGTRNQPLRERLALLAASQVIKNPEWERNEATGDSVLLREPIDCRWEDSLRDATACVEALDARLVALHLTILTPLLAGSAAADRFALKPETDGASEIASRDELTAFFCMLNPQKLDTHPQHQLLLQRFMRQLPAELRIDSARLCSWHRQHLIDLARQMRNGTPLPRQAREDLYRLARGTAPLRQELLDALQPTLLGEIDLAQLDEVLHRTRSRYRELLKEVALTLESPSWHSPSYGSSGVGERGPLQTGEATRIDYQRNRMPELQQVEQLLSHQWEERGVRGRALIVNSGMNAINTALHALEPLLPRRDGVASIALGNDIYFELNFLLEEFAARAHATLTTVEHCHPSALEGQLLQSPPGLLIVSSLTNSFGLQVCDVPRVLEFVAGEEFRRALNTRYGYGQQIFVVVDDTLTGTFSTWRREVENHCTSHLRVIAVESLLKYAQDGVELTQGGAIWTPHAELAERMTYTRNLTGSTPVETAVRRLDLVLRTHDLDERMERIGRNAHILAEYLDRIGAQCGIREVSYPLLERHPQHALARWLLPHGGGVLFIDLDSANALRESGALIRSREHLATVQHDAAQAFCKVALHLARNVGIELNMGTSFGFNTTRLEVHPGSPFQSDEQLRAMSPIRIAVGTEQRTSIHLIGAILARAGEIVDTALRDRRFDSLRRSVR